MRRKHRLDIILNNTAVRFSEEKRGWLTQSGSVIMMRAKAQRYAARLCYMSVN
jgi:hypothetical protein